MHLRTLFQFLVFFVLAGSVAAAPRHGISIFDPADLKYGPGEPFAYANPAAPKGGRLALAEFGAFTKLNPASLKGVMPSYIADLVFQTPMTSSADDDEAFAQYAGLVDSVDLAEDRRSLVYRISPDARFSDGHPVTADDFVFSFNLVKDPEYHPTYKLLYKDVEGAVKLDDLTVKFTFKPDNPALPLYLGQLWIFPKHVYGANGQSFGADFDETAVGSGPYLVDRYEFQNFITLRRNPDWWGANRAVNRGRYNFDSLTVKIYTDPAAMREGFKGGDFDAQLVNSSRDWALEYKGDFFKKGYYTREEVPHRRVAGMQGFVLNLRRPLFQSRKTRAALALAYDFDWSNRNLFYGQYARNESYFDNNPETRPLGLPEGKVAGILRDLQRRFPQSVPETVFTKPVGAPGQGRPVEENLRLAGQLLSAGGWGMGADGIRSRNGTPFRFQLLLEDPEWMRIAEPYQANLRRIGVDMEIKVVQRAEYEEKLTRFGYDMTGIDFEQGRVPGLDQRSMWGSQAARTPGSRNYAGIENPAIDALIESLVRARNREEWLNALQAMDRILIHQFYVVPHWYIAYDRLVYWNKFSRPRINPSQTSVLNNLIEWWWWDPDRAERLRRAMEQGSPMK